MVLKNISVKILPGEKVGVIGRTGAGKSSLVNALFRFAKFSGKILIDDLNINEISLSNLRNNLSIISVSFIFHWLLFSIKTTIHYRLKQEPSLFAGTLRSNLDPFNKYLDKDIWKALEQVNIVFKILTIRRNIYLSCSK